MMMMMMMMMMVMSILTSASLLCFLLFLFIYSSLSISLLLFQAVLETIRDLISSTYKGTHGSHISTTALSKDAGGSGNAGQSMPTWLHDLLVLGKSMNDIEIQQK
jgi:hypothetical protein